LARSVARSLNCGIESTATGQLRGAKVSAVFL